MDDIWFGRGATPADVEGCLRALSLPTSRRHPLLAVMTGDAAPRLILASRALFALFDVATGDALANRLLDGRDPGTLRLGTLSRSLTLDGAPHLERLRFFIGPKTEVMTMLCRRMQAHGAIRFMAALLGARSAVLSAKPIPPPPEAGITGAPAWTTPGPQAEGSVVATPMDVQSIQTALRAAWPVSRTARFLWQSNAEFICTQVTPPLGDIVGAANSDLVGRNLLGLAPQIDPTGRLAEALARKETWSGLSVDWPIADAPAAVSIGLGAISTSGRDNAFEGYRGYGVVHLDKLVTRTPMHFEPVDPSAVEAANVVSFPGASSLSPEDHDTFVAIGGELREDANADLDPTVEETPPSAPAPDKRAEDIARHGLDILDGLALGIVVSRENVPIFVNRHLLDMLGFADEDELYAAGGMTRLFDGAAKGPDSDKGGIRHRDGRLISTRNRVQMIDWDGLPATLLTLQSMPDTSSQITEVPDRAGVVAQPGPAYETPADEAPAAAEARELRAILDTATDGVAVIDADGNVTSLNRSGEALFGCDRGAVIGKPFISLFAPHNQGLASDYLDGLKSNATKRLFNDGRAILVNARRGGTIPVFMTLGRLEPPAPTGADETALDATGTGARFCALFRDLTHWKKIEQDLEAAKQEAERVNALKSEFLVKVSHEIRTPLNAIIGFAEIMMEERFGPIENERYKTYLRDIQTSGTHVVSLVNDLLDLTKIEAGKMELAIDAIDANKVIRECVSIMQTQASSARVIMRLSLAPGLPMIKADARALRQIVLNLLSNAVKFNAPGGQVIIATATPETGHVLIRVRDTGHGMSDTDVKAALEPFRQIQTGSMVEGTGLGLPLTKALVEANQATFTIRSKVDHGTMVEVAFPPARVLAG